MLRVAVPNKGSLADPTATILREAGYRQREDARDLVHVDGEQDVEFYYLRPRDVALYVGTGTLDVGVTGRDLLLDSCAPADEVLALGFGASRFCLAALPGRIAGPADLAGLRVATAYPGLLHRYLADHDVDATVIRLDGAVETAIRLGVADAIADVVDSGTTLRQAGLALVGEPILRSEAVLVRRSGVAEPTGLEAMVRRLRGVLVARSYVMVDYNVPVDLVEKAAALTPGLESPTISPLKSAGWVAVRSMVRRDQAQRVMDELWDVGARAILLTDIHACRI